MPKDRLLILKMLSTTDNRLTNDDKLTASKLKDKFLGWYTNFIDLALSKTIKKLENHCTSVMLCYGL